MCPASTVARGGRLARCDEVGFAAATTGDTNLLASVLTTDTTELYRFLTGTLGALPGLQGERTSAIQRTVKAESTVYGSRRRPRALADICAECRGGVRASLSARDPRDQDRDQDLFGRLVCFVG